MNKRFERTLSQILTIVVLVVFATTLLTVNMNTWMISYLWASSFLLAWVLMLVFGLYVLLEKESYGLSIFVGVITALSFLILSLPAILVLARFIPQMPQALNFGIGLLDNNSQLVLYTSLIVVYFAHLINAIYLRRKISEYENLSKREIEIKEENSDYEILDDAHISEGSPLKNQNNTQDELVVIENNEITNEISNEDIKNSEKIVFESNADEKIEYNIDNIKIVDDLTDEEIEQMRNEGQNG